MVEDLRLKAGTGSIVFPYYAAGSRGSIRVFYFRPEAAGADPPVVIAMHGFDRAASDFRNVWLEPAERVGLFVLVPEFDVEAFPEAHSYNYGNVRRPPPNNALNPGTFGISGSSIASLRR
jgi:poly(3-hydroxybutyrate) depolymerase